MTLVTTIHVVPARQNTPANTLTPVQFPLSCDRIAPAIGEVVKAPALLNRKTSPTLNPISFIGEIWATRVAIKETYAPEKKPNSTAKAIRAPSMLEWIGSQSARVRIPLM